jgi:hypothetical protein
MIPAAITALNGPGSVGFSLRQTYTVTMVVHGQRTTLSRPGDASFYAVPANVGPRTMPEYAALAAQGIYTTTNGIRVFAGTADDPFFIDLGAAFDTFNLRAGAFPSGIPGVLTPTQDASNTQNYAPDNISGYNVNVIAVEVPIAMLTSTGQAEPPTSPAATIGAWATTARPATTIRRAPDPIRYEGPLQQVQRMGNPLINELIIGTGYKDYWSMTQPVNDAQFVQFDLDPKIARVLNAAYEALFGAAAFPIPTPPRNDLLPLVTYAPPIAAAGTPPGPVADLLRLNTGVGPTPAANRSRLGLLGGDAAGYPNGRRVSDDVTDIFTAGRPRRLSGSQQVQPAAGRRRERQRLAFPRDLPLRGMGAKRIQRAAHRSRRTGLHRDLSDELNEPENVSCGGSGRQGPPGAGLLPSTPLGVAA